MQPHESGEVDTQRPDTGGVLNLADKSLTEWPLSIDTAVCELVLDRNFLTALGEVPSTISRLSLAHNQISAISDLGEPVLLHHLDVSHNLLQQASLKKCEALVSLNLSSNSTLKEIPQLSALKALRTIDLSNCNITMLENISLPSLQNCDASNNRIRVISLPRAHQERPPRLSNLNLANNNIRSWAGIGKNFLPSLTELDISSNKQLPSFVGLDLLVSLRKLKATDCALTSEGLVAEGGSSLNLPHLHTVDISRNSLRSLAIFRRCLRLQVLRAAENKLSQVCAMPDLNLLCELEISSNKELTSLTGVVSLVSLRVLGAADCALASEVDVAEEIHGLPILKSLILRGNSLCDSVGYPSTVLARCKKLVTLDGAPAPIPVVRQEVMTSPVVAAEKTEAGDSISKFVPDLPSMPTLEPNVRPAAAADTNTTLVTSPVNIDGADGAALAVTKALDVHKATAEAPLRPAKDHLQAPFEEAPLLPNKTEPRKQKAKKLPPQFVAALSKLAEEVATGGKPGAVEEAQRLLHGLVELQPIDAETYAEKSNLRREAYLANYHTHMAKLMEAMEDLGAHNIEVATPKFSSARRDVDCNRDAVPTIDTMELIRKRRDEMNAPLLLPTSTGERLELEVALNAADLPAVRVNTPFQPRTIGGDPFSALYSQIARASADADALFSSEVKSKPSPVQKRNISKVRDCGRQRINQVVPLKAATGDVKEKGEETMMGADRQSNITEAPVQSLRARPVTDFASNVASSCEKHCSPPRTHQRTQGVPLNLTCIPNSRRKRKSGRPRIKETRKKNLVKQATECDIKMRQLKPQHVVETRVLRTKLAAQRFEDQERRRQKRKDMERRRNRRLAQEKQRELRVRHSLIEDERRQAEAKGIREARHQIVKERAAAHSFTGQLVRQRAKEFKEEERSRFLAKAEQRDAAAEATQSLFKSINNQRALIRKVYSENLLSPSMKRAGKKKRQRKKGTVITSERMKSSPSFFASSPPPAPSPINRNHFLSPQQRADASSEDGDSSAAVLPKNAAKVDASSKSSNHSPRKRFRHRSSFAALHLNRQQLELSRSGYAADKSSAYWAEERPVVGLGERKHVDLDDGLNSSHTRKSRQQRQRSLRQNKVRERNLTSSDDEDHSLFLPLESQLKQSLKELETDLLLSKGTEGCIFFESTPPKHSLASPITDPVEVGLASDIKISSEIKSQPENDYGFILSNVSKMSVNTVPQENNTKSVAVVADNDQRNVVFKDACTSPGLVDSDGDDVVNLNWHHTPVHMKQGPRQGNGAANTKNEQTDFSSDVSTKIAHHNNKIVSADAFDAAFATESRLLMEEVSAAKVTSSLETPSNLSSQYALGLFPSTRRGEVTVPSIANSALTPRNKIVNSSTSSAGALDLHALETSTSSTNAYFDTNKEAKPRALRFAPYASCPSGAKSVFGTAMVDAVIAQQRAHITLQLRALAFEPPPGATPLPNPREANGTFVRDCQSGILSQNAAPLLRDLLPSDSEFKAVNALLQIQNAMFARAEYKCERVLKTYHPNLRSKLQRRMDVSVGHQDQLVAAKYGSISSSQTQSNSDGMDSCDILFFGASLQDLALIATDGFRAVDPSTQPFNGGLLFGRSISVGDAAYRRTMASTADDDSPPKPKCDVPQLATSSTNGVGSASVVFVGGGENEEYCTTAKFAADRVNQGIVQSVDDLSSFLVPAAEWERYMPAYLVEYSAWISPRK